jgi:hypothetical protein
MHTHIYEHMYANSISMNTSEGLNTQHLEILEVTIGASLSSGTLLTT